MTVKEQEENYVPEGNFGIIQLDHELLGKVLTEYAHSIEHIPDRQFIIVEDVEYDEDEQLLTAFINVIQRTEH